MYNKNIGVKRIKEEDFFRSIRNKTDNENQSNEKIEINLIGFFGSLILLIGIFCPFIITNTNKIINYFETNNILGFILIICAISSALLSLLKEKLILFVSGLIALNVVLYMIIIRFNQILLNKNLCNIYNHDDHFSNYYINYSNQITFNWGIVIMFIGIILILLSTIIKLKKN